jgi:hypothetical protein
LTNLFYGISVHKLLTVQDCQLDEIGLESLQGREQVDVDPKATCVLVACYHVVVWL